jgi:plastocyanin
MRRMFGWMAVTAFSGMMLAGVLGCKPSVAVKQGAVVGKGSKPISMPLDPATLGTVSGTVHFAGKPPARIKIDMSQDPACSLAPGDNYTEQYVVHEGKLANVYVYIKSGPAVAMTAPSTSTEPVVVDQVGCKYVPHVVALMRGGSIEFRNSDSTMHNIHTMPMIVGEKQTDVSQGPKGAPQTVQFKEPEVMMPVRCNNHPWMNAFVNVADTPFFAVTDADGQFEIAGLPAGDYVIAAVHEKLGEQTMNVTVKPHDTRKADFTYAMK